MKRDRDDVIYIRAAAFEGLHGAELVLRAHQQQLRLARTACRLGSQVRGVEHVERRAQPCGSLGPVPHFCTGGFCIFLFSAARKKIYQASTRRGDNEKCALEKGVRITAQHSRFDAPPPPPQGRDTASARDEGTRARKK